MIVLDASVVVDWLLGLEQPSVIESRIADPDVALALTLDAPLLTLDSRLAAAPHGARVELVA